MAQELRNGQADVSGNLSQQNRRNIPAFVKCHRCAAPIRVAELLVGTPLANLNESNALKQANYFFGFEDGNVPHAILSDLNRLGSDKLSFHRRLTILQQHLQNLAQILTQLVQRRTLRMSTGKSWNVADKQFGLGTLLNDGGESLHAGSQNSHSRPTVNGCALAVLPNDQVRRSP